MPVNIHYSFQLWDILVKPNAAFRKERDQFFYLNLNYDAKSLDEIEMIFREVDQMCKAISETTGKAIDADEMYLMVISRINDYCYPVSKVNLNWLFEEMDALLFKYMPALYSPDILLTLRLLKESKNVTTSIVGNTGFFKGSTLREVLKSTGISDFIDFQLYSDETRLVKRDPELSQLLLQCLRQHCKGQNAESIEVIYVQDNTKPYLQGVNLVEFSNLQRKAAGSPYLANS